MSSVLILLQDVKDFCVQDLSMLYSYSYSYLHYGGYVFFPVR